MNRSQLMVPKKPSRLLKTSKTTKTSFNQTFGVETKPSVKKLTLVPKVVKVKKAPVVNAY